MTRDPAHRRQLLAQLETLGQPRLAVVGDLILDRYTWGNASRISPEAPVLVLGADREESRLGGAAAVCSLLRGLGAEVSALGIVGNDSWGRQLRELLIELGVDDSGVLVDDSRPTTVKERFIGRAADRHPQQILRVDRETNAPLAAGHTQQLLAAYEAMLPESDAVLLSDYNKGCASEALIMQMIELARQRNIPLIVDPARLDDYSRYRGATLATPNRTEAALASGQSIDTVAEGQQAAAIIREQAGIEAVIVTLDREGMALVDQTGKPAHFPTTTREVYDITGAGDMVLAALGVAMAAKFTLPDAIALANVAAGLEVEHVGVQPVSREEIRAELLSRAADQQGKIIVKEAVARVARTLRERGRRIVFTNGCFDVLHFGHVSYLQEAAELGDVLIVGLNDDAGISRLKGPNRPINAAADRAGMLAALSCVDYVVVFEEDTPHDLLRAIRPEVLIKGGTYSVEEVVGREVVQEYGGEVRVAHELEGRSTTAILKRAGRE
jgi:D-beta-D-heptose 7-phosphate kinase/D-beta-D-heptose 1-phosphate adenosyltransferase